MVEWGGHHGGWGGHYIVKKCPASYLVITKTHNLTRTFSTKHSANFTGS
jgi:hypothetical protein